MLDLITLDSISQHKLIEGTIVRPLKVNSDESGILVETLKTNWTDVYSEVMPFAQQYYSVTNSGIARDENQWHFHPGGQQDRFIVISGEIVAAIADNEENSPTKGLLNLYHMKSRENPYLLVVPKRAYHIFMVVSRDPATLLNFPTRLYDPKEEGRIPFENDQLKTSSGKVFSWNLVREQFQLPVK